LDATVPEDLTFIQASLGLRRFLATPLHEIIAPKAKGHGARAGDGKLSRFFLVRDEMAGETG
jgi:hypothetical protein